MPQENFETDRIKRIVLAGHDNSGSRILFEKIYNSFKKCEYLMIIAHGIYYQKSFLSSIIKLLRESSFIFLFFRFLELLKYYLHGDTVLKRCRQLGIPVIHTKDINSQKILLILKKYNPDILVSLYTMQIYKKDILNIPKYGCITSHPSILPYYRGLEIFFWVLANDERETGVSVFYLNGEIDAGRVIRQRKILIPRSSSVFGLYKILTEVAGELLVQAINDIDKNQVTIIIPKGRGSYFPMPTREAVKRFLKAKKRFF